MTARPPAPAARVPDDELAARVRTEVARIYATSGWVPPIGTGALTAMMTVLLWDAVDPVVLTVWAAWLAVAVLGAFVLFLVPASGAWRAADGVPMLAYIVNAMVGVAYGLVLWLDPAMVDVAELRWMGLVGLFALSAGVTFGLSGLHRLALAVAGPAWLGAAAALLVGRQWIVAAGGLTFLGILVVDQRRSGDLWKELVSLRVDHELRAEEHRWWAEHDELTGLLSRGGVLERLRRRGPQPATVLYIDLDHFKEINDASGHAAGDDVLVAVARRLTAIVGVDDENGLVGRLGGDEFVVIFDEVMLPDRVTALGEALIAAIELPIETRHASTTVSASVGATTGRLDPGDPTALISQADHALLTAKRLGRRRVVSDAT